jgi:hypothetical protein
MTDLVFIADEPYLRDELMFKTDPEAYMWQAEMADYIESCFTEEDWR